ncbi:MAG: prepilin peptidase [Oscillospiraceae bacterium]|nr:prepilin peptidase [Oscillospiraceae bacterium]MDD4414681.1 prepilin peptidase [Oscillospiraceae bacterium]
MEIFIHVYTILIGLIIGSFLNVLIYRVPLKLSFVKGASFCPKCKHKLSWLDLFPVLSYIFLFGKCRYCKDGISPRYPAIELLNALCYYLVYLRFGLTPAAFVYAVICSCLIVLAMIDYDHKIIPDRFNIIIGIGALILGFITKDVTWTERIIGFFAVSLPLLIIALITGGVGEGDVKLIAVCGLLLGWKLILLTMLFASVFAAIFGIVLIAIKKAKGKTQLPFGPFIAFSVIICMLYGENIINLYISFLMINTNLK